jgi:hypothetical protein
MRVTSAGRPFPGTTIHSDSRKNPLRPGRFKKGDADAVVRSSHLGYDCYVTGRVNDSGRTRIVLRTGRLPAHFTADVIAHLPAEMWWPTRDHTAAHATIDAVLQFDVGSLLRFKDAYPDHEFGFERYIEFCQRRASAARAATPAPRLDQPVRSSPIGEPSKGALPAQLSRWPSAVEDVEKLYAVDYVGYVLKTNLVTFEDGASALSVEVWGRVGEGRQLCSRAYIDLITGEYEIRAHHPGRLQALALPLTLLHDHLGIRTRSRVRASIRRIDVPTPKRAPEPGLHSVMRNSRDVEGAITGGGKRFTEDLSTTGRTTHGRAVPDAEDDIVSFPSAPGGAPA